MILDCKYVAINELGRRIGEGHHNAILTDAEVELLRDLREIDGMSYSVLAEKFEISKWAVGRICRYERRAQTPARYERVHKAPT
ncbi:MAG: hypothetical protein LBV14_09350 [Acidovorax sp.]|nr:hypothetical protein [Acidovorax sp.]